MTVLTINDIVLGAIIAAGEEPKGGRRDIGGEGVATDGSTRITRSTRKRDLKFRTIYLTEADAHAWESLLIGEGEVWSFDTSLYGSKGLGPSSSTGATIAGPTFCKFGTGKLNLAATTGTISFAAAVNAFGSAAAWTVCVWRSTDTGATWTHYAVRSDGAKWVAGVRDDAASTTWLSVDAAGVVTIANTTGAAVQYDDLAVLPYLVLTTWPAVLAAATRAWTPLPYLDAGGTWVTEQTRRRVFGQVEEARSKTGGLKTVRLDVQLKAR